MSADRDVRTERPMIELPDHIARRIKTAATLLVELSKDIPLAPTTVFGLVASISSGAPEAEFPREDVVIASSSAGELNGIAFALGVPLPLVLVAAGVDENTAADDESMANARSMAALIAEADKPRKS